MIWCDNVNKYYKQSSMASVEQDGLNNYTNHGLAPGLHVPLVSGMS